MQLRAEATIYLDRWRWKFFILSMGSDCSVGKCNSKYAKVRIFQAIIKGTGMIPDFHILCCVIIIILFAGVRMKILYMYTC